MGLFRTPIEIENLERRGTRRAIPEALDLVVFAEPGDMIRLGVHSLEGLNLKIDPVRKVLVPAGPVIAALLAQPRGYF